MNKVKTETHFEVPGKQEDSTAPQNWPAVRNKNENLCAGHTCYWAWGLLPATKYAHVIFKRYGSSCSFYSCSCCQQVLASANDSRCCSSCCCFCSSCCSFCYCCSCLFHSFFCSSPCLPRPCPLEWLFICTFSYALKYNRRRRRPCNSSLQPPFEWEWNARLNEKYLK